YRVTWIPVEEPAGPPPALTGTWLLLVPAAHSAGTTGWEDVAGVCAEALSGAGADVVTVTVDTSDPEALPDALARASRQEVTGVLSLLALATSALPGHPAVPAGLAATAALVRALDTLGLGHARLWLASRAAVGPDGGDPVQAQVWGLGRAVALEYPRLWGG